MQFDKTQKRALVFVAGLLGLSWYMGNQFEKTDMMRSEGKRPCCSKPSMYFTMRGLSCRNCSKEDRIYRPAKEDSFNQMRSEADGYAYAYNEGHSDSRKNEGYQPTIENQKEESRFRKIIKQRAETFNADSGHFRKRGWVIPKEAYPRHMRVTDNNWAKDFYCDEAWVERHGDEYTLNWVVHAYKPTKVQRPAESVFSETYPYTERGWFNGYMRWAHIPMRGKNWSAEVQEKLGAFISKRAETFGADDYTDEQLLKVARMDIDNHIDNGTFYVLGEEPQAFHDGELDGENFYTIVSLYSQHHEDEDKAETILTNMFKKEYPQYLGDESFNAESEKIDLTQFEGVFRGGHPKHLFEEVDRRFKDGGVRTTPLYLSPQEVNAIIHIPDLIAELKRCYGAETFEAETMTPSEVEVKVTKDVTPKGSKVVVEECVDIQAKKADATSNFYRVRFRDPSEMSNFRVPAWAARAANTMGSKYYDVTGSKVTMGQDKSGNWKIQSVMIPKRANVDVDLALKIANHIQDRLEKEGKWAPKKCQDNERVLVIR